MFKTIASIALATLAVAAPYQAAHAGNWDYCESLHGGTRICAKAGESNDVLAVSNPNFGYIRMGVKCTLELNNQFGWEWEIFEVSDGHGYTREDVNEAAISFCEGRLGVTRASANAKYYMA
jgi:hypothetical protein